MAPKKSNSFGYSINTNHPDYVEVLKLKYLGERVK
jgi:hypothetical protein